MLHSCDIDEVTDAVGKIFHPRHLTRIRSASGFEADLRAISTVSMVTCIVRYNRDSDLYCPLIDGYHLNLPLSGQLVTSHPPSLPHPTT